MTNKNKIGSKIVFKKNRHLCVGLKSQLIESASSKKSNLTKEVTSPKDMFLSIHLARQLTFWARDVVTNRTMALKGWNLFGTSRVKFI